MKYLIILQLLLICSCNESVSRKRNFASFEASSSEDIESTNADNSIIDDVLVVEDENESSGYENDYRGRLLLDSTKKYIGVDYYGVTKTCSPPVSLICTQELTAEDSYGHRCRADGIDIVYCGCHDPICIL